ncbi:ribosomal protein S18-alanine N-acetyltransferase [Aurantimonas sp. CSK15Z-1]|nr:ribosomal protein S18-alanine N-acetyltransferase [Aurantimonas sp. CSK15Z-1]
MAADVYWYLPWLWTLSYWDWMFGEAGVVPTPLEPDDLERAAELHSEAFSRAWSADEFASLLAQDGAFGFLVRRIGQPREEAIGVVLARASAGEAEILTIAVDRKARRQGIGRLLMDHVLQHLHAIRCPELFLEVDEENAAALSLYRRLRFQEVGRRPAYYTAPDGRKTAALVLKRELRQRVP